MKSFFRFWAPQVAENRISITITIYVPNDEWYRLFNRDGKKWKLAQQVGQQSGSTSGEDILGQYNVTPAIAIKDADRVGNQIK